jgi:HlyD family secretion protein
MLPDGASTVKLAGSVESPLDMKPRPVSLLGVCLVALALAAPAQQAPAGAVAARGRIRPKDGVLRVAGPSDFVAVVGKLNVDVGDRVQAGQVLAVMDTLRAREARVARVQAQVAAQGATVERTRAELANARLENDRRHRLSQDGVLSAADRDTAASRLAIAEATLREAEAARQALAAELTIARAERDMSIVQAPVAGVVLEVHARPGEKVGAQGILELGRVDTMYAIGEVYETDIGRVRVGQRAVVRSPALGRELGGVVERLGLKVGKLQSVGTDLSARTDGRIVEVEIRLDEPAVVAGLIGLEVEVLIRP